MYNGHDSNGYCPITDEEIEKSEPFVEHSDQFSGWGHRTGVPDFDRKRNAYHIRYLADLMEEKGWIGPPIKLWVGPYRENQPLDGNHRIRACKYLFRKKGIVIKMEVEYCDYRG